jgi:hypothetical protein
MRKQNLLNEAAELNGVINEIDQNFYSTELCHYDNIRPICLQQQQRIDDVMLSTELLFTKLDNKLTSQLLIEYVRREDRPYLPPSKDERTKERLLRFKNGIIKFIKHVESIDDLNADVAS